MVYLCVFKAPPHPLPPKKPSSFPNKNINSNKHENLNTNSVVICVCVFCWHIRVVRICASLKFQIMADFKTMFRTVFKMLDIMWYDFLLFSLFLCRYFFPLVFVSFHFVLFFTTSTRDCTSPNRVQALNINAFIYIASERQTNTHTYTHTQTLCEAQRKRLERTNNQTNKQTNKRMNKKDNKPLHKAKLIENGFISVFYLFHVVTIFNTCFRHCTSPSTLFGSKNTH